MFNDIHASFCVLSIIWMKPKKSKINWEIYRINKSEDSILLRIHSALQKFYYKIKCNISQNTNVIFLLNIYKQIDPKFIEKDKGIRITKITSKRSKFRNLIIVDVKLYYKATIIKTGWYKGQIHRSVEQNREPRNRPTEI